MTDEHPAGAERVAVPTLAGRVGDPLPGRGLHQLAQHPYEASRELRLAMRIFMTAQG
jgi:hypothetical protein